MVVLLLMSDLLRSGSEPVPDLATPDDPGST
jgi:hypothetical protein